MPLLSTVYCTVAELERFISSDAANDWGDHDNDGTADTDVVEDAINQATEEIDFFLRGQHAQSDLASSTLITRWCCVMAAKFLAERRGNPPPESIQLEFDRIADPISGLLAQVADRKRSLPGVNRRVDAPGWSNLRIDRRRRVSTVRVTHANSNDQSTTRSQDLDDDIGFDLS